MSTRARLMLDAGLFAALLAAFSPYRTGLAVHEWLSVAIIVPLLFHLIINWTQTVRMIDTIVERIASLSPINLVVDVALFVCGVTVVLSGLMVSQVIASALGVSLAPSALWSAVHSVSADGVIVLLLVHLGLHARWMTRAVARLFAPTPRIQEER